MVHTIDFSPFRSEYLGSKWQVGFGNWQAKDGLLCHVLPVQPDSEVAAVISGSSGRGVERLSRRGLLTCALPGAGFQAVTVRFKVRIQCKEMFAAALDDWAVVWEPRGAMQAELADTVNWSRPLDYDDAAILTPGKIHEIKIQGELTQVRFFVDNREVFAAPHRAERGYRNIQFESFCGAQISDLQIDGQQPRSVSARKGGAPLMAVCVDFSDDILYAPFNADMLELLVKRLADLGIGRIYWLNTVRVRPEALGSNADPRLSANIDAWSHNTRFKVPSGPQTIRNCYPFLPKVCSAAHARGMEVYAVHKNFDLGFFPARGNPSPYTIDHFIESYPEAMLERLKEPSQSDDDSRPVHAIRFFKDDNRVHGIKPAHITLWISEDNVSYHRYPGAINVNMGIETKRFARHWEGGHAEPCQVQVITLDGLDIRSPYFAVTIEGDVGCSFRNQVCRLAEVLDDRGRPIPHIRNQPEWPRRAASKWDGQGGFEFDGFTTSRAPTGGWRGSDWIETEHALDGTDLGTAFHRGQQRWLRGTPNPAHPAVHEFWTDWVKEALEAGVDGVDMRIIHHRNILDWANYGFGPLVEQKFNERYSRPLRPDASCRADHMALLGDCYTDFLRKASRMVREAGAKFQHHISMPMDTTPEQRAMTNIRWDWQGWIREGILDAITLKNLEPASSDFFDEIMGLASANDVQTYWCPYLNCIISASESWAQQLTQLIQDTSARGMDGIILYENASFLQANEAGDLVLKYPEFAEVLQPV